jgi:two-component system sensor histidine kinase ChiS
MSEWVDKPVILCVDDEASVLEAVRSQLLGHYKGQFDIEIASSGAEAIEIVSDLVEDGIELWVIICDEIMPERRGHDVLAEVHVLSPKTKKILLTGQAGIEAVTESVNRADLFRFIAKPWERLDLLMTIDHAVESLRAEEERIKRLEVFHRFVPSDFLAVLGVDDPIKAEVNMGMMQDMSVLFTDIRNFTALSEVQNPETVFASLNSLFDFIVPVISAHDGVIDKFIGDAVMALFKSADQATRAGLEIVKHVEHLETPMGSLSVGVGINSGGLILGTVGNDDRIQTTVIGDVVNVAARIEALTKSLLCPLLLSEDTANQTTLDCRYLGRFEVKGRSKPLPIHQCLEALGSDERQAIVVGQDDFSAITQLPGTMVQETHMDSLKAYSAKYPADTAANAIRQLIMTEG